MNKLIVGLVLATLLVGVVAPMIASAQVGPPETCKLKKDLSEISNEAPECKAAHPAGCKVGELVPVDTCGLCCLVNTIYNVTDWIFYLMLMATVILVVIGGAIYMMSAGDSEKAGKGKSLIIYGIIGLAIAVFAKAVPSIVKLILAV